METPENTAPELSKPHMSVLIGFSALALAVELLLILATGWAV